jgi:predicted alpha-1,6-mannanase (GH76 family)
VEHSVQTNAPADIARRGQGRGFDTMVINVWIAADICRGKATVRIGFTIAMKFGISLQETSYKGSQGVRIGPTIAIKFRKSLQETSEGQEKGLGKCLTIVMKFRISLQQTSVGGEPRVGIRAVMTAQLAVAYFAAIGCTTACSCAHGPVCRVAAASLQSPAHRRQS